MPDFLRPAALALLPLVLAAAVWLRAPWIRLARMSGAAARRRERARLLVRGAVLALLCLALAGPGWVVTVDRQAVVFAVDASDSVGASGRERAVAFVRAALAAMPGADQAGVLAFGRRASVEVPVGPRPVFPAVETQPGAGATDLSQALRLGQAMLPAGFRQRVVLLTDGRSTVSGDDAAATAAALREQGVRVDVVPVGGPSGPDVRLDGAALPAQARVGEETALTVSVWSDRATAATLSVTRDDTLVVTRRVGLAAGANRLVLSLPVGPAGTHRYDVRVQPDDPAADAVPENDAAGAFQTVLGPPRVLVVARTPSEAAPLVEALRASGGVDVQSAVPEGVPATPDGWARYAAVFLVDVPATDLGSRAMDQIEAYVRAGGGLVMTGGPDSFGLGGYAGTPVERALPVEMHISGRGRQPSVGLVLVIDKSGSMEEYAGGGDKMSLAKEAAARAVGLLTPRDQAGVIAFDTAPYWVVPLQPVSDPEAMRREIGRIYASGGTEIYPPLVAAYQALRDAPVQVKHVILLTDGMSASGGAYVQLVQAMRQDRITLSTVAVGQDADTGFLRALADLGGGRFHYTADALDIPSILTQETLLTTRSYLVNERFTPRQGAPGAVLAGISQVPPLDGYITATPKPTAEVDLVSHRGDPVLATWQYGLGRAAAWTPDVAGRWSAPWVASPVFPRLWGNVLSWLLPPAGGPVQVQARVEETPEGPVAHVSADDPAGWGELRIYQARLSGPDGQALDLPLHPAGPGRYEADAAIPRPGAWLVRVVRQGGGGAGQDAVVGTGGFVTPYPAEYRNAGVDGAALEAIARAGGGQVLSDPSQAFAGEAPPVRARVPLTGWVLGLALALFWWDVARRRLGWDPEAGGVARRLLEALRTVTARRRVPARPGLRPAPRPAPSLSGAAVVAAGARVRARLGARDRRAPGAAATVAPAAAPATAGARDGGAGVLPGVAFDAGPEGVAPRSTAAAAVPDEESTAARLLALQRQRRRERWGA